MVQKSFSSHGIRHFPSGVLGKPDIGVKIRLAGAHLYPINAVPGPADYAQNRVTLEKLKL